MLAVYAAHMSKISFDHSDMENVPDTGAVTVRPGS